MSDLSSEKTSIRHLPDEDTLSLITEIRAKRREAIISTAQRWKTAPRLKKDPVATLVSKLSTAERDTLILELLGED